MAVLDRRTGDLILLMDESKACPDSTHYDEVNRLLSRFDTPSAPELRAVS